MNDTEIDDVFEVGNIIDLTLNGTSKQIETIIIDDEQNSQSENKNVSNNMKNEKLDIDSVYKENKLLAEFIEKCLDLEHSEGMLRIIKRTLIRVYKDSDKKYKNSPEFETFLQRQINFLEVEPHRKFSHMKNIIETLKFNGVKKRAKLTTLATNLKNNNNNTLQNKRFADFGERIVKRSKKDEIIDLDSETNEVQVINLDDDQSDVIVLDEPAQIDKEKENMEISEINHVVIDQKDDNIHATGYQNSQNDTEESSFLTPQIEMFVHNNLPEQQSMINEPVQSHINYNDHLDVSMTVENRLSAEEEDRQRQIKNIENQIKKCKQIIQQLDEAEVVNDNLNSPYIICEKVKTKIVVLYKELCELTGNESIKKRTVRLQVQEGHPAGPVRRLEEFINNNLGEDGDPQFPDFSDVTMCVLEANKADRLGWNKTQILREACALFTQCGLALQKRRQKREWRDMLATVKVENLEYDPADEDPVLLAKLEQNHRLAQFKENELLDRYVRMQEMPAQAKLNKVTNANPVTQNGIRILDSLQNEANENATPASEFRNEASCEDIVATNKKTEGKDTLIDRILVMNNPAQNSLVIIKTEVSVEFENPDSVGETPGDGNEPLHLDAAMDSKSILPCSEKLRIKEAIPDDNVCSTIESNVQVYTEIESSQNENYLSSVNRFSSCEMAVSSSTNVNNLDSDINLKSISKTSIVKDKVQETISKNKINNNTIIIQKDARDDDIDNEELNSDITINSNSKNRIVEVHVLDTIPENETNNNTVIQKGAGDFVKEDLVNEETNLDTTVRVKKEPVDVAALLDGLGDSFSADIVDIEDPFLVIQISDSSDEED